MSHKATDWAFEVPLPPLQKLVLLALADRHNKDTNRCDPSIDRICDDTGMSRTAVKNAITELRDKGLLNVHQRKEGTVCLSNFYSFNLSRGVGRDATGGRSPHDPGVGRHTTPNQEYEPVREPVYVEADASTPPGTLFSEEENTTPPTPSRGPADVIREHLFPYYLSAAGRGDYLLTPLRLKKGVERLRECLQRTGHPGLAVEQFEQAIDGLTGDPWNCGDNPQKKKYLDWIDHLCKSTETFDKRLEAGVPA